MKILVLCDPFAGPAYIPRLRYLCDYLTAAGHNVQVITERFQEHTFEHAYPITELPSYNNTAEWVVQSIWSLLTDYRNRRFSRRVRQLVKSEQYDLVFCTTFSTFPLRAALDVAREKNIPLHVDLRDVDEQVPGAQYQYHRQWWTRPLRGYYKWINIQRRNKVIRQADHITTISPWHVEFLKKWNPNVELIYNGYDPKQFYPENRKTDQFIICYIGRIYPFQHPELIEEAVRELGKPDIKLEWHTPENNPIPISQTGEIIRQSSLMLVMTSTQACGMMTTKFYEALGCEKPILAIPNDNGVLNDAIRQHNAGQSASEKEETKQYILEKYNEWKQMGYTHQEVVNKEQFSRLNESQQFEQNFRNSTHL